MRRGRILASGRLTWVNEVKRMRGETGTPSGRLPSRTSSPRNPNKEMPMSDDVVIVSAARTPVGSFNGAFATPPAHALGAVAIKAALERAGIEPGRVSEVIMGQILTAAQG